MKTILLLRHTKSSRGGSKGKDFDRPLARRGKKEAPLLGLFVKEIKTVPHLIKSSPANRAKQTTELFIQAAGIDSSTIKWDENLYYGGARDYLSAIQKAPDNTSNILLVGHNPLLEETVSLLCSDEGAYVVRMPPGALVCLEYPAVKWKQIKTGMARMRWMITPDLLKR